MRELRPTLNLAEVDRLGFTALNRKGKSRTYRWSDVQKIDRVRASNFGPYLGRVWLFTGFNARFDLLTYEDARRLADSHQPRPADISDASGEVQAQAWVPGRTLGWTFDEAERWLAGQGARIVVRLPPTEVRFRHGSVFSRPWVHRGRKYGTLRFVQQADGILVRAVMGCELNDVGQIEQAGAFPRMTLAWRSWVAALWQALGAEAERTPPPISRWEAGRMVSQGRISVFGGVAGLALAFTLMYLVATFGKSLPPGTLQVLVNGLGFGIGFPSMMAGVLGGLRYRSGKALLRILPPDTPSTMARPAVTFKYRPLSREELLARLDYFRQLGFYPSSAALSSASLADQIMAQTDDPLQVREGDPVFLTDLEVLRGDKDRVWWEDAEADVASGNDVYVDVVQSWSHISRGAFEPIRVQELWKSDVGPLTVRFMLTGKDFEVHPEYLDDFIDLAVLSAINAMIGPTGIRLEIVDTGGQDFFVVALTPEERLRLERERQWKFLDLTSP